MRGRKRRFCSSRAEGVDHRPDHVDAERRAAAGAGACCISSWKMYCCTGLQPVPPHSTGQCGTAQPLRVEDARPRDEILLRGMVAHR